MNKKKQELKHYHKISHSCRTHAIIACKKLEKRGVHVRPYKRGKLWYVTERIRGERVLRILDELREG